jgi:hypothetical protein
VITREDNSRIISLHLLLHSFGKAYCLDHTQLVREPHKLGLRASGADIVASLDGEEVLRCKEEELDCGGFGFLVETGNLAFQNGTAE